MLVHQWNKHKRIVSDLIDTKRLTLSCLQHVHSRVTQNDFVLTALTAVSQMLHSLNITTSV